MSRGDVTPRRRLSSEESRIPVPSSPILRRSGSVRLSSFSPIAEHARNGTAKSSRTPPLNRHRSLQCLSTPVSACLSPDRDDDVDSVQSFGSATSSASQCDHACFARNGTTYSSRQRRFVVHCSPHNEPGQEYLTPTQRANSTIRKLKQLLQDKQSELIDKEREIFRLTKEVVELRLVKAASASISTIDVTTTANENHTDDRHNGLCSPPVSSATKSMFNDVCTPTTPPSRKAAVNGIDQRNSPSVVDGVSPLPAVLSDVPSSLVDSGHFEDLNSSSSCTRDWTHSPHSSPLPVATPHPTHNQATILERLKQHHEDELRELNEKYEAEVRLLKDNHIDEIRQLKDNHNDEIRHLKENHNDEIRHLKDNHNDEIRQLKESHNDEIWLMKETHNSELPKFKDNSAELKELNEKHNAEISELKERHNDKVDSLLQRITEANDRFCALRPKLEEAENRIRVLETENEELKRSHQETEEKQKAIYLEMYNKGQEAAKLESDMHQGNGDTGSNSVLTENEKLLKELNLTKKDLENVKANYRRLLETRQSVQQQDPEITLNFLKSAVYYFLTDRENSQRHLSAIESILGFTDNEKMNIEKAYLWR